MLAWIMLNNALMSASELFYTVYNLFLDSCQFIYTNIHTYVPVNRITKSMCPVLMAKSITPVL